MTRHLNHNHPARARQQSTSKANESIGTIIENLRQPWTQAVSDNLLMRLIVHENLPFRLVESPHLRALLLYQPPSIQIPKSAETARGWAITDYGKTKSQVRELLKNALTSVHLSIDGWTSPQQTMAVLGIVAHFVGGNGRLYGIVLGFEELDGPHSGNNIAESVLNVVEDYGITSRIPSNG